MKQALLAAVVSLGLSSSAEAITGAELRERCAINWDLCHGFIVGAAGMFWYQMEAINPICFRKGTTWEQIHDIVIKYLEEHPETREENALILVTWAMRDAFDCPATAGADHGEGKEQR